MSAASLSASVLLYAALFGVSVYLALLARLGLYPPLSRRALMWQHGLLAVAFGVLALGTAPMPVFDLRAVRAVWAVYLVLLLWLAARYWLAVRRGNEGWGC